MNEPNNEYEKHLEIELLQACLKYFQLGASPSDVFTALENTRATVTEAFIVRLEKDNK